MGMSFMLWVIVGILVIFLSFATAFSFFRTIEELQSKEKSDYSRSKVITIILFCLWISLLYSSAATMLAR
jgi:O-antigen/teichoic acid export membrane protein